MSRFRHVRSPACGSPETSSTRSLSRTPSIVTTARLLTVCEFAVERRRFDLDDVLPAMRDRDIDVLRRPDRDSARFHDVAVAAHRYQARCAALAP